MNRRPAKCTASPAPPLSLARARPRRAAPRPHRSSGPHVAAVIVASGAAALTILAASTSIPAPRNALGLGILAIAINDSYTTGKHETLTIAAPSVLANDTLVGDTFSALLNSGTSHGNLTLNADGGFVYSPDGGYSGTDQFTYHARGSLLGLSNVATVTIMVLAPSPTPTATASSTPRPTGTPVATAAATLAPSPSLVPIPSLVAVPLPTVPLPLPTLTLSPPQSTPTAAPTRSSPNASPASTGSAPTPEAVGAASGSDGPPAADRDSSAGSGSASESSSGGSISDGAADLGPPELAIDPVAVLLDTGFSTIDWAVPALVLTVPGLLLILAVGAQTAIGVAWLPVVRHWLAGLGVRRRPPGD